MRKLLLTILLLVFFPANVNADPHNNKGPIYPELSRRLGEQGKVVLKAFVNSEGLVEKIELIESSGFERLDQAALNAVNAWEFIPRKKDGIPQSSWAVIPITFNLDQTK